MEWIDFKEQEPEFDKTILVGKWYQNEGSEPCMILFADSLKEIRTTSSGKVFEFWDISDPSHWMPIPELPNKPKQ